MTLRFLRRTAVRHVLWPAAFLALVEAARWVSPTAGTATLAAEIGFVAGVWFAAPPWRP